MRTSSGASKCTQTALEPTASPSRSFHFEFDTGRANVIDPAVSKELGVANGGSTQVTGAGSASSASSFAVIKTLQVGNALVTNQVFVVLPIAKSLGMAHEIPMDGVIGYGVLSRFMTTLDYANRKVVFHMRGSYMPTPGATVIPIVQYGSSRNLRAASTMCQRRAHLITGARGSISLFTPFIKAHPSVVPIKLTARGVDKFGVGGPHIGRLGRLQTLSFAGLTLDDLVADYTTQTGGGLAMPFIDANIGWKRFTMTLDYHELIMTLTTNADFSVRDHWDRSGLFLINNRSITIIDVRPGTLAEKVGLKKGDVIVSLNGSSNLSLHEIRSAFLAAPGTVEHLVIKSKDGDTHNIDLTLADYV